MFWSLAPALAFLRHSCIGLAFLLCGSPDEVVALSSYRTSASALAGCGGGWSHLRRYTYGRVLAGATGNLSWLVADCTMQERSLVSDSSQQRWMRDIGVVGSALS